MTLTPSKHDYSGFVMLIQLQYEAASYVKQVAGCDSVVSWQETKMFSALGKVELPLQLSAACPWFFYLCKQQKSTYHTCLCLKLMCDNNEPSWSVSFTPRLFLFWYLIGIGRALITTQSNSSPPPLTFLHCRWCWREQARNWAFLE